MEIYKDIPNYELYYQSSNFGNIRRKLKNNKFRILKPIINQQRGYFFVILSVKGKGKLYYVHQLIAMTFLNFIPNGHKLVVNHKDFNKGNNELIKLNFKPINLCNK